MRVHLIGHASLLIDAEDLAIGPGPGGLTHAAAAAIRLLVKQDHARPRSTDTLPPGVQAIAAKAKRGSVARLRYVVSDDSGRSRGAVPFSLGLQFSGKICRCGRRACQTALCARAKTLALHHLY